MNRSSSSRPAWIRVVALAVRAAVALAAAAGLVVCPAQAAEPLVVFAASSLTEAFGDVASVYARTPGGCPVSFNFGSSNTLRVQLEQGARADVFATASQVEMERAVAGHVVVLPLRTFARNKLAVMVPRASELSGFLDLAKTGLKVVLAQKEVPAGAFALQFLDAVDSGSSAGFRANVLANVVSYEPNVKQVVAKVQLGEADAGVVYSTDATPANSSTIRLLSIPDPFNVTTLLPAAITSGAAHPVAARKFVDFLISPAGQASLRKRGFLEPPR